MLIYHQLIGAGERAENKAIFPEFTKRIKSYKKKNNKNNNFALCSFNYVEGVIFCGVKCFLF